MATFLDIATDAIASIGQVGIGQSVSNEESAQALRVANRMLSKWSIQRLMLYVVSNRSFTLAAGTQDYTVGPSGVPFVGTRPTFVEAGQAVIPNTLMQNPLNILTKSQWDAIADLGSTTSVNGVPDKIWPEYSFPNLAFHVHPIPAGIVTIKLGTWERLQQIATIFDVIAFPDGYEEAVTQNLAMELCPFYDMQVSETIAQLAADSLLKVQALNAQTLRGALGESQTLNSPNTGQPVPTGAAAG